MSVGGVGGADGMLAHIMYVDRNLCTGESYLDSSREILKGAYESELEIHKSVDISWVTFISKLLDSINSDHFLNTTDNVVTKGQMGRLSDKLKTQLAQDNFQYNFQNIGEYSKLRIYVKFKLNSNREDYL